MTLLDKFQLPAEGEEDRLIETDDSTSKTTSEDAAAADAAGDAASKSDTQPKPQLTVTEARGVLEYLLGKNCAYCEETGMGKKRLLEALRLLSKTKRPVMFLLILIDLRNQLAVNAAEAGLCHIAKKHLHAALDLYDAYKDAYLTERMTATEIERAKTLLPLVPRGAEITALVYALPRGCVSMEQAATALAELSQAEAERLSKERSIVASDAMPLNLTANVPALKEKGEASLSLPILEMYCLEKHHARSTFYLGQVYARLEMPMLAAAFCRRTLTYSLSVGVPAHERAEWARNAVVLAEFYTRNRKFSHAHTCLRAACAMLGVPVKFTVPRFEPLPSADKAKTPDEQKDFEEKYERALAREKQCELLAKLAMGWGALYAGWLAESTRQKILRSSSEEKKEAQARTGKPEKSSTESDGTDSDGTIEDTTETAKSPEEQQNSAATTTATGSKKPNLTLDLSDIKAKEKEEARMRQRIMEEAKEQAELEHELASVSEFEGLDPPEQRLSRQTREEAERDLEGKMADASLLKVMDENWFPALQPALGKARNFQLAQKMQEITNIIAYANYYYQQAQRHFVLNGFVSEHVQCAMEMSHCLKNMYYFDENNLQLQILTTSQRIAILEPLVTSINPRAYFEVHHDLTLQCANAYAELMDIEYQILEEMAKKKSLTSQEEERKKAGLENLMKYGNRAGSMFTYWMDNVPAEDGTPGKSARKEPLPSLSDPNTSEAAKVLSADRIAIYKVPEEYMDQFITTGLRLARVYSRLVPQKKKQFVGMLRRSLAEYERLVRFIKLHGPEAEEKFSEQLEICNKMLDLTLFEIRKILAS